MRETKLWTWHMVAGIAIGVLGGLHMIIMHLDSLLRWFNPAGPVAVDWENVLHRSTSIFFVIMYILLLLVTLFHGFMGLRNILLETSWGNKARRGINVVLWFFGIALAGIGTYAAIAALYLKN